MKRRRFFSSFAREIYAMGNEVCGNQQLRLFDISSLSDESMLQIMPRVLPNIEITMTETHICARRHANEERILLFDQKSANIFVFNHFNGFTTIGQISASLADHMAWDKAQAYDHTRDLFLKLVQMEVCMPDNPIEE